MPYDEVCRALESMYQQGVRFLYFSGGEPTVRDDLPDLIVYAAKMGYAYLQLNTNGLRIAQEPAYAQELCEAGLSSVFLQFDGTEDSIYCAIRGKPLMEDGRWTKKKSLTRMDER